MRGISYRFICGAALSLVALAPAAKSSELASADGAPCLGAVEARITAERAELDRILARHHGGDRVDGRLYGLPQNDFDDATNLTVRQRVEFRRASPAVSYPKSGPLQYPRWAYSYMNERDREGTVRCGAAPSAEASLSHLEPARVTPELTVNPNIDASNDSIPESETYIAIDPHHPQYLVGGSNINLSGRGQMMYASPDYGTTWTKVELVPTRTNHSDPGVAFDSHGNVFAATLDYTSNVTAVKFYKSTDHGLTYPTQIVVDDSAGNDKELAAIDSQTTSSCRDQIYVGWDNGKAQFVSSTTAPNSGVFRPRIAVQTKGSTIACDLAVGPPAAAGAAAPVYTAWTSTATNKINVSRSSNCGSSWSAFRTVATTVDSYDYGIPAQCNRRVLIYPSLDVDRSSGARRGWVYVVWNDFTAPQASGCIAPTDSHNANIWFSRSTDGGATWSAPLRVNSNLPRVDHFNQWMRVDDTDGAIHVMWRDTRNDPNRKKTDVYYTKSLDGGATFLPEVRVTTAMSDETTAGASPDQYGDYEGIAAALNCASPFWTDRRTSTPEEIDVADVCP